MKKIVVIINLALLTACGDLEGNKEKSIQSKITTDTFFEECVLREMKNQNSDVLAYAEKICKKNAEERKLLAQADCLQNEKKISVISHYQYYLKQQSGDVSKITLPPILEPVLIPDELDSGKSVSKVSVAFNSLNQNYKPQTASIKFFKSDSFGKCPLNGGLDGNFYFMKFNFFDSSGKAFNLIEDDMNRMASKKHYLSNDEIRYLMGEDFAQKEWQLSYFQPFSHANISARNICYRIESVCVK